MVIVCYLNLFFQLSLILYKQLKINLFFSSLSDFLFVESSGYFTIGLLLLLYLISGDKICEAGLPGPPGSPGDRGLQGEQGMKGLNPIFLHSFKSSAKYPISSTLPQPLTPMVRPQDHTLPIVNTSKF